MPQTFTESFKVAGHQLLDAVKRLVHEGNVRRVIINADAIGQQARPVLLAEDGQPVPWGALPRVEAA